MRIIAGKYRGRKLKSPPSLSTRPTSDRLRETLFNILALRIEGARFLDLCAGSGAVGIEALSHGAAHAVFVDQSTKMCALIEANLAGLEINEDEVEVFNGEAQAFLHMCAKKQTKPSLMVGLQSRFAPFDIIFFDPPYTGDYEGVLDQVGEHAARLLSEDGIVVIEHHKKKELQASVGALKRYRMLRQGDSCLSFYEAGQH